MSDEDLRAFEASIELHRAGTCSCPGDERGCFDTITKDALALVAEACADERTRCELEHGEKALRFAERAAADARHAPRFGLEARVRVLRTGRIGIIEKDGGSREPRWYVRLGPTDAGWRCTEDLESVADRPSSSREEIEAARSQGWKAACDVAAVKIHDMLGELRKHFDADGSA